jgi:hypothetical protein
MRVFAVVNRGETNAIDPSDTKTDDNLASFQLHHSRTVAFRFLKGSELSPVAAPSHRRGFSQRRRQYPGGPRRPSRLGGHFRLFPGYVECWYARFGLLSHDRKHKIGCVSTRNIDSLCSSNSYNRKSDRVSGKFRPRSILTFSSRSTRRNSAAKGTRHPKSTVKAILGY